jgi:tetratricopeptide (TPR) repeat protein
MKVCVYGICLNEAAFVDRFMDSAAGADLVVIADTGSTDGAVARFRARGAQVHEIRITPWRFDAARNAALDLVPDDVDVCVSLDLDQVLRGGWRAALERGWAAGSGSAIHPEVWGRTPSGEPRSILTRRVHARHGWRWILPAHEYLEPVGTPGPDVVIADLVIEQFQDEAKARDYLPLLELAVAERPLDPFAMHNLGRELLNRERLAEAETALRRYLEMAGPDRGPERNMSIRMLADAIAKQGRVAEALPLWRRAADDAPALRGAQVDLAWALYQAEAWAECYAAAARAAAMALTTGPYGEDSLSGVVPDDMASLCAWRLGRPADALAHARRAAAAAPGVERIQLNLQRLEAALGTSRR